MQRYVYTLNDPRTNVVRYVGMSSTGITRLCRQTSKHFKQDLSHRAAWLSSLKALGLSPNWNIVETCKTDDEVSAAERHWIAFFRAQGNDLTNHMDGGFEGRPDEVARARMRESHIKTHCKHGHEFTPENTGVGHKPGTRYCKACRAAWFAARPDYKTNDARRRYLANPEPYKARSAARAVEQRDLLNAQARARYTTEKRYARHLVAKAKRTKS